MGNATLEESVAKAARELHKDRGRTLVSSAEWTETDGLLAFRGKIYVPNDHNLRRRIVAQHHDSLVAGHPGGRLWSSSREITGGHSCLDSLVYTFKPVTLA